MNEPQALETLRNLKRNYQQRIRFVYEHAAQDCAVCPTRGACCMDAHFVNVHITRLEALAIREKLSELDEAARRAVAVRVLKLLSVTVWTT